MSSTAHLYVLSTRRALADNSTWPLVARRRIPLSQHSGLRWLETIFV